MWWVRASRVFLWINWISVETLFGRNHAPRLCFPEMGPEPIPKFSEQTPKTLRVGRWVRVGQIQGVEISRIRGGGRQEGPGRSRIGSRRGIEEGAAGPKPRGAFSA